MHNIFPNNEGVAFPYNLRNWWDWLKAWFTTHSNVIFLDIEPTWCDKNELIRLAVFKLLVDFVEKEKPNEHIEWLSDDGHKNAQTTFMGAYYWIKTLRPQLVEISGYNLSEWGKLKGNWKWKELPNGNSEFVGFQNKETKESKAHYSTHNVLEKVIEETDDKVLTDIIKIRGYLWT
jgi:hypothetical protein